MVEKKKKKSTVKAKPKKNKSKRNHIINNPNKGTPKPSEHGGGRPVEWTAEAIEDLADKMLAFYEDEKSRAFLIKQFTVSVGIPSEYISRFCDANEKFNQAYKRCKDIMEVRLASLGMLVDKPTFAIFCLKANYGWKETQAIEHKGSRIITVDIEEDNEE